MFGTKIIEILLLYGNKNEEFEDVFLRTNAEGEIETVVEKREYKVYQNHLSFTGGWEAAHEKQRHRQPLVTV
jgi:hypothetical protein